MQIKSILLAILVMAGVTYLIRVLPLVLIRREIKNKTIRSFLHYVPYVTLSVMTVPAIFSATAVIWSAVAGFAVAVLLAYFRRSLVVVAAASSLAVLATELLLAALMV